jgi:hypothetical protein
MRNWPPDMKSQQGLPDNPLVRCPCGRQVNADMMRDVRSVKEALAIAHDYVCDSCMEHYHRTGKLSREAYYRAAGAPAHLVTKAANRERVILAERGKQT